LSWDAVLMAVVELLRNSDFDDSFFVTRKDLIPLLDISSSSISSNLSVCVKNGWLRREDFYTKHGREVRYYVANTDLLVFVDRFLKDGGC